MAKSEDAGKITDPVAPRTDAASALGPSIVLSGEITGDEDLVLRGTFQGKIRIRNHDLFIERGANVEADVEAAGVAVSGSLTGNIRASGRVVLSSDARMKGDITAAKIHIRDGAQFRGSIKMAKGGAYAGN
jgi:cytoskeletal protein CcmA (bactofilin family)